MRSNSCCLASPQLMPAANALANLAVCSGVANAWYIWNSAEPSVSFGSPGARESVRIENTSFFSSSRGTNSGMVLW
ncbi:hypothetical protein G6F32_017483 [Rhizopus arrhizus]|uniref:Uncharacterized protein n=1 Tax=Rhizopus delemar TaxID=936053 RepID=A0A9P7BYY8_9FUNG|nr:hypothetical protein G6F32_017483 [Rhizopus arrhizus]KAG1523844.1 hypothetical protein G6F50_018576 [Rhizopus delemar]